MPDRKVLLAAALAVFGSHAAALPVHVTLDWPTSNPSSGRAPVHIRAVCLAGQTNNPVPVEGEAGLDGVVLGLGEGVWQVEAFALGYWSQGTQVTVPRHGSASVRLALWPATSLHGVVLATEGGALPGTLGVRLSALRAASDTKTAPGAHVLRLGSTPSRAELRCRIDGESWSCMAPVGLFDVRLEAADYAPRYEWGVSLRAEENTDLGRTELRRAASVFGRAVRRDGSNPPVPCRAILRGDVDLRGALESDRESAPQGQVSFSMPLNQRGYFQILGVPPGKYVLAVECQAAGAFSELRVLGDSETRIDPPLLLEEQTLDIAVTPKVDPAGRPWQITLDMTAPRFRRIADKVTASGDGLWARRGLMAGSYRVTVNSSDGTPWLERDFDLGAGSGPLSLRLASVRVAGRVRLNTKPVPARLVFFNESGGEPVTLSSDDHGRFQGLLPVAPGVQETSWTVDAHVAHPPMNRRLVGISVPPVAAGASGWLELALPMMGVRGTVVSENGQRQRSTQVTFEDESGTRTITATDDAGNFELPELPPGKYTAVADSLQGASERNPLQVVEGIESVLKLIVHPSLRIAYHVVSSQGPVADAAVQIWIPPGVPRWFTHTDQDGRFEINLPPGTAEVGLTIGAPGYALKMTRMPISNESDESPDAKAITLDPSGGTLVLNLQAPGRIFDHSVMLYLVHNGAIEEARALPGWGTDQAGVLGDGPAVVEAIEPGNYALCLLRDPEQVASLWRGALPAYGCHKGSVEQGGTLTLSAR